MDLINYFDILFDNRHGVVFTGEEISGRVLLDVKDTLSIKAFRLEVTGKAQVCWVKIKRNSTENQICDEKEEYFSFNVDLPDKDGKINDGSQHISAGRNEFPFHFSIMEDIPTSFEGDLGNIRYLCRATLIGDEKLVTKRAFTVINHFDLNTNITAEKSSQMQHEIISRNLCCKVGAVFVTISIPCCGYVPGQFILLSAEIRNNSRAVIQSSKVKLLQLIMYHSKQSLNKEINIMTEVERGAIQPWTTGMWDNVPIPIPAVPPTDVISCKIIDISYQLEFHISDFDLDMTIPILIGTIPLKRNLISEETKDGPDVIKSRHITPEHAPMPLFGENIFGAKSILEDSDTELTRGQLRYAPFYPICSTSLELL